MTKRELINYCLTFPNAYEDYPFDDEWAFMRHEANRKGFAFIYERGGRLCVNLKCDPFQADFFRQTYNDLNPAYHMNHTHWNTVTLDGDVPDDEMCRMIESSYDLIKPMRKAEKKKENE